ncbi:hypothetical protein N658DRAFT_500522, partial [Parathielavia hyrcaniae]
IVMAAPLFQVLPQLVTWAAGHRGTWTPGRRRAYRAAKPRPFPSGARSRITRVLLVSVFRVTGTGS